MQAAVGDSCPVLLRSPTTGLCKLQLPTEAQDWVKKSGRGRRPRAGKKWQQLHSDVYAAAGQQYPHCEDTAFQQLLQHGGAILTARERSVLNYVVKTTDVVTVGNATVDLSQSIARTPLSRGGVPCVVPNSCLFHFGSPPRLLTPLEHFLLQGCDLHGKAAAQQYRWGELLDLAGNAFSGHSIAAALLALLVAAIWSAQAK